MKRLFCSPRRFCVKRHFCVLVVASGGGNICGRETCRLWSSSSSLFSYSICRKLEKNTSQQTFFPCHKRHFHSCSSHLSSIRIAKFITYISSHRIKLQLAAIFKGKRALPTINFETIFHENLTEHH